MDEIIPPTPPSPWQPERDPLSIAVLGKMLEEVNELGAALSRCLIQGIDEQEPQTGYPNRNWLEDEMADITATGYLLMTHFHLRSSRMEERCQNKIHFLLNWHAMIQK
jgi:hypothetical protein